MTDLQKEMLLDIFVKNSIQEIEENRKLDLKVIMGVNNSEELLTNTEYIRYYQFLKKYKESIEEIERVNSQENQLKNSIFFLYHKHEKDSPETFKLCLQFVKKCLFPKWKADLQTKFAIAEKYFLSGFHFFVSYTTRNVPETNKDYKALITDVYDEQFYDQNKLKNNLVVSIISKFLVNQGLKTFYDRDILKNGDELKADIENYCSQTFAFVQFVELVMFRKLEENDTNWTFFEYNKYSAYIKELMTAINNQLRPNYYFVVSDPDGIGAFPANLPDDYVCWKGDIQERLMHIVNKSTSKTELRGKLKELSERILKKREKALGMFLQNIA